MKAILQKLTRFLAVLAFGLLLPGWLAWTMMVGHVQLQRTRIVEAEFDRLSQSLETLNNYHADRVFFHGLFQQNFAAIDGQTDAQQLLAAKIAGFRKMFPGKLRFIVYDSKGVINQTLTDEKKFQYVLKSMYGALHELQRLFANDPTTDPSSSSLISERMQLLRGYFGPFLVQKFLLEPLQREYLGRCLFVSDDPEKRLLWYYPGRDFSVVCFVDASLLGSNLGAKLLINRFNASSPDIKIGIINALSFENYGLPASEKAVTEIILETGKFTDYAIASRESANFLLHFRQASADLLLVSYLNSEHLPVPYLAAVQVLAGLVRWLVIVGFIIYCASLRLRRFALPVQQKIMLLFLFANGLPLLMLASVGYEFFSEKKKDLINATHQESVRVLKEFDVRFPEVGASLARRLNVFIDERNRRYNHEEWPPAEIDKLKQLTAEITPQEAVLYNNRGETVFKSSWSFNPSEKMVKGMLLKALEFFNSEASKKTSPGRSFLEEITSEDLMLQDFLWFLGRFVVLNSGDSNRVSYLRMLGGNEPDTGNYAAWGAFGISWDPAAFIRTFVIDKLKETAAAVSPRQIMIFDRPTENVLALNTQSGRQLRHLFKQTVSRKLVTRENLEINGSSYLFTAIAGNEISDGILGAIFPQHLIDEKLNNLKATFFMVGLVMAFVLFQVGRFFAARLLVPVAELDKGITRMRARDFDYRISYRSADELGDLIATFNRTLEGMKELAVGTAVQESLLPLGSFSAGRVRLFARSLFMSKMGGDYYDYYPLPANHLGIFFGDVAGHGIPAAMLMAMVKAVIAAAGSSSAGPQELLASANQVLLELKKRNWRRMMTAVCFDLNPQTGEFIFANAGHCYPAVVEPGGKTAVLLEQGGMPLGSSSRKILPTFSGCLKPGDTLVLYTDGIVEAVGKDGLQFGYPRFVESLQSAWDENLEAYWQKIIDGHHNWAIAQDDDLTFLLLRMEASNA
ncbi:MAG TPA: SpoIIE family protein phosphatase [Candidatus Rifleibacterium sp.]|mgnify:CR=1 FL=1|nr:SpoIIE family protein phosphatase [Candidatus Rifleibacterium sp.]